MHLSALYRPVSSVRLGRVYRVPILSIDYAHLQETVSTRVMEAERKIAPKRTSSNIIYRVRSYLSYTAFIVLGFNDCWRLAPD